MTTPKRKQSKSRTRKRRAHQRLDCAVPGLCPQCHQPKPIHRACPHCGYYRGKKVMSVKEE
ncbi:MAG: 50S ribosomal protein L32 [Candidatus Aureabacteria bacterium]|nr:50S ribosomal protein L32 [Candidatus Auribacterota bacterium]